MNTHVCSCTKNNNNNDNNNDDLHTDCNNEECYLYCMDQLCYVHYNSNDFNNNFITFKKINYVKKILLEIYIPSVIVFLITNDYYDSRNSCSDCYKVRNDGDTYDCEKCDKKTCCECFKRALIPCKYPYSYLCDLNFCDCEYKILCTLCYKDYR